MASREEKVALFKSIGLGDVKIEETLKNESLSNFLCEIINTVNYLFIYFQLIIKKIFFFNYKKARSFLKNNESIDKTTGVLLYHIATRVKTQIKNRLSFIIENVMNKNLLSEAQLNGNLFFKIKRI